MKSTMFRLRPLMRIEWLKEVYKDEHAGRRFGIASAKRI